MLTTLVSTVRSLRRAPGLCINAVATLALGLAALIVTFGVVHAALFRPPPFEDAEKLAMLYLERQPRGEAPRRERWSFPRFEQLRAIQRSFEDVASYSPASLSLSGDEGAHLVQSERVSASYFSVLRTRAELGRLFTEAEDRPGRPQKVVVLGHDLWTRRFSADPEVIGRAVRLNGVPLTVIGVLPPGFAGLSGSAELWIPRTLSPLLTYPEYLTTNQNFISAVGRLRPGVDLAEARAELDVLGPEINRALPSDPSFPEEAVSATAGSLGEERTNGTVRRSLFVLLGAVALLHLLACANVANLLLGRAASRRREASLRMALGSGRWRLLGHLLTEGAVVALSAAGIGTLLAWWASDRISPPANVWAPRNFYGSLAPFDQPAFSSTEMAFALVAGLVTTVLVASPPALSLVRLASPSGLRTGGRTLAGDGIGLRRPSLRGALIAVETALALLLVVSAGLLLDSFRRMHQVSLGVEPDHVLTFWVMPSEAQVPEEEAPAFVTRLLDALSRVPGVEAASVDGGAPLSGSASSTLHVEGRPAPATGQAPPVLRHYVGSEHFRTLGIPLLRGRVFEDTDTAGTQRVTVISETAARRFWPDEDPLGQRVWFGGGSDFNSPDTSATIVGIVGDVVYRPLDREPNFASFYTPYRQFTYASRMVFLRTAGPPMSVLPEVRRAIAAIDSEVALQDVQPLRSVMSGSWARNRFDAWLFASFGVAALLLAASGVFAVVSHAVSTGTRELGIRMALGADRSRVLRKVLGDGMTFPLVGAIAGSAAAAGLTRLLRTSLFEVSPLEPSVFLSTVGLLLAAAVAACLAPAWRATFVDPAEVLRAE